ncbi:hypothetical protein NP590_15950 [Methylomonas sp. SURF-2]|uniref:Proton-coupled thiamine transporter YuaJ n=1 Tax=Methylomonas subterranea TaxID=2952225 RepID=A0ABT1TJF5_9GAMM|nr:hypothetical protein [Methylomonas sp. SURF-2]MCQ8105605.1 hypothetical protein [Methylomonas sp. SURF-2]
MNLPSFTVKPGAVALMALMAATRFHHFGTPFALPDASLAIFFLAGLWLGGRYLFAGLLLEAGLIDYLAITQLGVSDFCVSPAYVFLIPAYAAMWLGGSWCGKQSLSAVSAVYQFAALVVATSSAFLLSNGSFYLLSGKTANSWDQYAHGFAQYYPSYLSATLLYVVVIFTAVTLIKSLLAAKNTQQTI